MAPYKQYMEALVQLFEEDNDAINLRGWHIVSLQHSAFAQSVIPFHDKSYILAHFFYFFQHRYKLVEFPGTQNLHEREKFTHWLLLFIFLKVHFVKADVTQPPETRTPAFQTVSSLSLITEWISQWKWRANDRAGTQTREESGKGKQWEWTLHGFASNASFLFLDSVDVLTEGYLWCGLFVKVWQIKTVHWQWWRWVKNTQRGSYLLCFLPSSRSGIVLLAHSTKHFPFSIAERFV